MTTIASASSIMLCGQCVGTDKVGHFFEEGMTYHHIKKQKGEAYAIAWGYWTEGLVPPGMDMAMWTWLTTGTIDVYFLGNIQNMNIAQTWATFGDEFNGTVLDPNGSAGMADLAANESGMAFYDDLAGSNPGTFKFDICKYMKGKDWSHITKKNKPGAPRGSALPPAPVVNP